MKNKPYMTDEELFASFTAVYQPVLEKGGSEIDSFKEWCASHILPLETMLRKVMEMKKRESIMVDALSEVLASSSGKSNQPIDKIVNGCIAELRTEARYDLAKQMRRSERIKVSESLIQSRDEQLAGILTISGFQAAWNEMDSEENHP